MSLRLGEIYVSLKTKRRLRWIKDAESPATATQDEIADRLLNQRIEQLYPDIAELERELDAAETELMRKLGRIEENAQRPTSNAQC